MNARGFTITYGVVTPESAVNGEESDAGFVARRLTLREARDMLRYEGDAVSADCWPWSARTPPRWLTFAPDTDYRTGAETTKSLHLPNLITASSAVRVARLFRLRP